MAPFHALTSWFRSVALPALRPGAMDLGAYIATLLGLLWMAVLE